MVARRQLLVAGLVGALLGSVVTFAAEEYRASSDSGARPGSQVTGVVTPLPGSPTGVLPSASPPGPPLVVPAGFPDAGTTGPQGALQRVGPGARISGAGWHYDPRGWVTAEAGAVLDGLDIPYNVDVVGDGVVIRRCRISLGGDSFGVSIRHARDTLIEDSAISSDGKTRLLVGIKDIFGDSTRTVIRRVDISQTSTGVQIEDGTVEDSFIHGLQMQPGDHVNGMTSNGGQGMLTVRHNTVANSYDQTDAISLFQDFAVQENRSIVGNYLAGGGYALYGGGGSKGPTRNIKITDNAFSTQYFPKSGHWGPITYFAPSDPGNEWQRNTWADGPHKGDEIIL